jgi:hypothetical protein
MNPSREPDPTGNRARQLMFAPELNLAILENRTHKGHGAETDEQQIWTYRFANAESGKAAAPAGTAPRAEPPVVEDVVVSVVSPRQAELTWKEPLPHGGPSGEDKARIAGYHVERAVVDVYSDAQLKRLTARTPPLARPSVGALRRIGPFQRITSEPLTSTSFTDPGVDLEQPQPARGVLTYERDLDAEQYDEAAAAYPFAVYAYRVRTVNSSGQESGPSPAVLTIPSAPQWVFSQEDGSTCRLKWAANPEQGVQGYRVYRMDGRWDSDPVARLTDEPIDATTYADEAAGADTHRYYVIAVDALGQEGFPSAPVWFNREWRPFYEPFVGQWHQ